MNEGYSIALVFTSSLLFSSISRYLYNKYLEYQQYEKEVIENDIDDVKSLLEREQKNLYEYKCNKQKMVYVSGVAYANTKYKRGEESNKNTTGIYTHMAETAQSSIITGNPKNGAIRIAGPKEIIISDSIKSRWRFFPFDISSNFSMKSDQFLLIDSHEMTIRAIPYSSTKLFFVRFQRTEDIDSIKSTFREYQIEDLVSSSSIYDRCRQVLYDGDKITIGGFLSYNIGYDKLEISDVEIVTGGGKENLIYYFKEMKHKYGGLFIISATVSIAIIGYGTYLLLRYIKNRFKRNEVIAFKEERKINMVVPDDECCIVCMDCRRDIIL